MLDPGIPLPSNYFMLFSTVIIGLLTVLGWLVRSVVTLLHNHLAHDLEAQKETAAALAAVRALLQELLTRSNLPAPGPCKHE